MGKSDGHECRDRRSREGGEIGRRDERLQQLLRFLRPSILSLPVPPLSPLPSVSSSRFTKRSGRIDPPRVASRLISDVPDRRIDIHEEARKAFMEFCLSPSLDSFLRDEIEPSDFYIMVKDLSANSEELLRLATSVIAIKSPGEG